MTDSDKQLAIEPLTPEAFNPFGQVIELGVASQRTINDGRTERFDFPLRLDVSEGSGAGGLALYHCQPIALPFSIQKMERHPLSTQTFIPLSKAPFLVVVAPPSEPLNEGSIKGFITNGAQGVHLGRGTWHHSQLSLYEPADYWVLERLADDENCDEVALVHALNVSKRPLDAIWPKPT